MTTSNDIWYDYLSTPIGKLLLAADAQGLREVWFETGKHQTTPDPAWKHDPAQLAFARKQLEEYFAGTRTTFDLPLHPIGTPFQVAVWHALAKIPYGTTISYGDMAKRIGQPQAVRAVGAANGRNPLPIVLPCHRVIGADGSLTGFGGGLPTKRYLLAMEDQIARGDLFGVALGRS
ncbi:methylated-DNA--[protein]-cysteine S-methyltransferase [Dyella nitratireducens]|uniref:Methylated-DNA--protein-cysteine methyltransferase n=1 Tax=Dyella nitratireducens TaxID=1849580 RepID=A0ABQ1GXU8_9GAMM|nr:methylated-DNA--[protein]-cysteine S-methyltransferase [Dyella nitratireducens]GGA51943.1 methylated-DNA--protein-cysteine methyltransferase [Dyella nitratireducens]GLQ41637.1 methylated-DNA--protein-cysteine methyltransferase [Dyella nitratireducens]